MRLLYLPPSVLRLRSGFELCFAVAASLDVERLVGDEWLVLRPFVSTVLLSGVSGVEERPDGVRFTPEDALARVELHTRVAELARRADSGGDAAPGRDLSRLLAIYPRTDESERRWAGCALRQLCGRGEGSLVCQ